MADLETGDEAIEGLSLSITVTQIDDEYWSSVDLHIPEDDEDHIDGTQFLVLKKGLEIAAEKIDAVIQQLEEDEDED